MSPLLGVTTFHWLLFTDAHLNVCLALFNSRVLDPSSFEARVGTILSVTED